MTNTTRTSRERIQNLSGAKKVTKEGPVLVADLVWPAQVLLSADDCQRLTQRHRNIADTLAMPGAEDVEFEPLRVQIGLLPSDLA